MKFVCCDSELALGKLSLFVHLIAVCALNSAPGKTSKLMCKNGAVQYNKTLLGGYDAGKFKLLSHSTNMSACIRLCCGEMSCDVALMIERKCYSVACKTLRLCQAIPAKNSIMLNHLSPQISFMTSRNEEGMSMRIIHIFRSFPEAEVFLDIRLVLRKN